MESLTVYRQYHSIHKYMSSETVKIYVIVFIVCYVI